MSTRGPLLVAALGVAAGCAPARGEADDVCAAERLVDEVDEGVWTIGVQLPGEDGGTVHVEARWPDEAGDTCAWPVALMVHGAWDPLGTPVSDYINQVLNDPGPSDPFYGDNPAFHNGVIAPDSLTPADAYPYP